MSAMTITRLFCYLHPSEWVRFVSSCGGAAERQCPECLKYARKRLLTKKAHNAWQQS